MSRTKNEMLFKPDDAEDHNNLPLVMGEISSMSEETDRLGSLPDEYYEIV